MGGLGILKSTRICKF